eukprot:98222-Prorocentrum_minimum.AAC.2
MTVVKGPTSHLCRHHGGVLCAAQRVPRGGGHVSRDEPPQGPQTLQLLPQPLFLFRPRTPSSVPLRGPLPPGWPGRDMGRRVLLQGGALQQLLQSQYSHIKVSVQSLSHRTLGSVQPTF